MTPSTIPPGFIPGIRFVQIHLYICVIIWTFRVVSVMGVTDKHVVDLIWPVFVFKIKHAFQDHCEMNIILYFVIRVIKRIPILHGLFFELIYYTRLMPFPLSQ